MLYTGLYGAGDISQQTIRGREEYDWRSCARIAFVGATFFAPFNFFWYKMLDRHLPGTRVKTVLRKILLDQLIAGSVGITVFFTCKHDGATQRYISTSL